MLFKCARPDCNSQFRFLRDGQLFHLPALKARGEVPQVEHFWLCEDCSRKFTVVAAEQGKPVIAARAKAGQ